MKKLINIKILALSVIVLLSACSSPSYLGKSYPSTQHVDVYYDVADVKRPYTTMGTTEIDKDLRSLEATQQKVIEFGKSKGADGVITKLVEEELATQESGGGTINTKKKNNTYSSSSTTTKIMKKKITATYIKYE